MTNTIPLNTWRHVAFTVNSATEVRRLYINGAIVTQDAATAFAAFKDTASSNKTIGTLLSGVKLSHALDLRGDMDAVYFFDRALETNEINAIFMNTGSGK